MSAKITTFRVVEIAHALQEATQERPEARATLLALVDELVGQKLRTPQLHAVQLELYDAIKRGYEIAGWRARERAER